MNNRGYIPQLDKHSEQAVWQAVRMQQTAIADWIKSHRLSKITKMTVHIHSEREMCGQCAATSAEMVANLVSHAPEIAEALKLAGGADAAGTPVTSTHKFRGAAPSADPATASAATPTADAPSGKKQSAKPPGLGRG